jgi:hypothetical protein
MIFNLKQKNNKTVKVRKANIKQIASFMELPNSKKLMHFNISSKEARTSKQRKGKIKMSIFSF